MLECLNINKQIKLLEFNIKKYTKQRYKNGYIFFIPLQKEEDRAPYLKGIYQHVGIYIEDTFYECFNYENTIIQNANKRIERFSELNPIYIPIKNIDTWKIYNNVFSGTCCDEFVARVIGLSNNKGTNKGEYFPEDIYKLLKRR